MYSLTAVLDDIEESNASWINFLACFLGIVFTRMVLEFYSSGTTYEFDMQLPFDGIHQLMWFLALGLSIVAVLHLLLGVAVVRLLKLFSVAFVFIFIAPILDLLIEPAKMTYLLLDHWSEVPRSYFSFAGGHEDPDKTATLGLRMEVAFIVFSTGVYGWLKTRSVIRAMMSAIAVYSTIFAFALFPFLVENLLFVLRLNAPQGRAADNLFDIHVLVVLNCVLTSGLLYWAQPNYWLAIVKDIRPFRVLHYLLMAVLGFALIPPRFRPSFFDADSLVVALMIPIALIPAVIYTVVENNLEDIDIDRLSNPTRPHVREVIPPEIYRAIGRVGLAVSFLVAATAGFYVFFYLALCVFAYSIYSVPPVKLRRFVMIDKFVIGFNSFAMASMTFYLFCRSEKVLFPSEYAIFLLLFVSLASNFVDIKDADSDPIGGVRSLVTLYGVVWGKRIIAFFQVLTYGYVYRLIGQPWMLVAFAAPVACHLWLILRVRYREQLVFLFTLSGFVFLIGYQFGAFGG